MVVIFFGSFYLVNLMLAVVTVSYQEVALSSQVSLWNSTRSFHLNFSPSLSRGLAVTVTAGWGVRKSPTTLSSTSQRKGRGRGRGRRRRAGHAFSPRHSNSCRLW